MEQRQAASVKSIVLAFVFINGLYLESSNGAMTGRAKTRSIESKAKIIQRSLKDLRKKCDDETKKVCPMNPPTKKQTNMPNIEPSQAKTKFPDNKN